jgi:hypothetical protein
MVGQDILHPVRVSPKERKSFILVSLVLSRLPDVPFPLFFTQRLPGTLLMWPSFWRR